MDTFKRILLLAFMAFIGWTIYGLQGQVADLERELSAERSGRAGDRMAQQQAVILAMEQGREQERADRIKLVEVINALDEQNRDARGDLADARRRLRQQLEGGAAAGAGGADLPAADAASCPALDAYRTQVLEAVGRLVDGVLSVGADADEAARTFNSLIQIERPGSAP